MATRASARSCGSSRQEQERFVRQFEVGIYVGMCVGLLLVILGVFVAVATLNRHGGWTWADLLRLVQP